jgi:2-methylcitrate dehydratase PrpD
MTLQTTPTETLASFAAGLSYDDLPNSARQHAKHLLLDSVACALAGDLGDEVAIYAKYAQAVGGTGNSTVIGSPQQLSLLGASLLNGYLITAVTVCDTYVPAHVHITPEVVPPALAIAERDGADGRALLTAIAAGAEIAVRVAAGIDYSVAGPRGWHFPGIVGPFGAAAAVGRLRGLSQLQMRNAFGLAGSQSAGTWASWGSPAVKFHQSRGAASGLIAGLLAEQDFAASADILTHSDGGMLTAYSDGGKPEALVAAVGTRFEFERISLRLWPGGTPLQPTLTALFDLLPQERPVFDDIQRVRISVAPAVYEAHARFTDPKGTFEALLSYPFTVASALRDGRFWLDSVGAEKIGDAQLKRFMGERIELSQDPGLTRERSRVEVTVKGGRVLAATADAAKGTPANPATLPELRAKFEQCVAGRLTEAESAAMLDLLVRADELDQLSRLFELMRSTRVRPQAS